MNNEDVGKLESFTADRIEYSVVTLENSLAVPQKVKHRIYDPTISPVCLHSQKKLKHTHTFSRFKVYEKFN